jgi:very-short-patch-repair endonuclease
MPGVPKRPLRFQLRSIIRHEVIQGPDAWWMVVHRRGLRRATVGANQLEARAVPHSVVPGYLDERILYAALVNLFHFVPGIDFQYQSSIEGGRIEMGGLVADFLFPTLRIVINPLGPQHYEFRATKKDEEQIQILAEMGYQVYMIDQSVVYDEFQLEEFLRRVFGGMSSGGGDVGGLPANSTSSQEILEYQYEQLYQEVLILREHVQNVLFSG